MANKEKNQDRKLRLVEKYENDDHSRFAAPDYIEEEFDISSTKVSGQWQQPGISGDGDYDEESDTFIGKGPKGYKRSDNRIYEEICEILMQSPEVDATDIVVKVDKGIAYLSGKVNDRNTKKTAESLIWDIPGVEDIRNELLILSSSQLRLGAASATRKDLGV